MSNFAVVEDLSRLWRTPTKEELPRAEALLPVVSAALRTAARQTGRDLDAMIAAAPELEMVARSVTVDVVARTLMTSTDREPVTQFSESAGGYTASGTFLVPGGGLFIKRSELERLGLRRQKIGVIDFYGGS